MNIVNNRLKELRTIVKGCVFGVYYKNYDAPEDAIKDIYLAIDRLEHSFSEQQENTKTSKANLTISNNEVTVCNNCGNKLTDKEIYFGQCLQCGESFEE